MVGKFARHFAPTISKPRNPKTLEDKRKILAGLVRQDVGAKVEIKESYTKQGELMQFQLYALTKSNTRIVLAETEAKRLSNARDKAYREALKAYRG